MNSVHFEDAQFFVVCVCWGGGGPRDEVTVKVT